MPGVTLTSIGLPFRISCTVMGTLGFCPAIAAMAWTVLPTLLLATLTKISNKYLSDVRGITKDKDQNLWFATFGNGIIKNVEDQYNQISKR